MDISGNTILITGGGSGIGGAAAKALHAAGNQIIIAGRRREALETIASSCPGMAVEVLDIQDAAAVAAVAAKVVRDHPALNVLINNAGVMKTESLVADPIALDNAEAMVVTNLLGPIRMTAALLPHLRAQPKATVINVSSGLAFVPMAESPTYSATKAAIHSYSQSLRHQLAGTSVEVIEWAPPAVATDLIADHSLAVHAMPLDAFIDQSLAVLRDDPAAPEILVGPARMLRDAATSSEFGKVFAMINGG